MPARPPGEVTVGEVRYSYNRGVRVELWSLAGELLGEAEATLRDVKTPGARFRDPCDASHRALFYPLPPPSQVASVYGIAKVEKALRRQGWGVWMYAELARLSWQEYGVALVADDCSGGKTSEPAKRVWASSRIRQYCRVEGHVMVWGGGASPMPRPDSEPSVRTAGDLLPIMDPLFNVREACKQSALLEDHLNQPRKRCPDCIRKHFLTLEALFEEAVSLSSDDPPWAGWAERVRGWAGEWAAGRDPFEVAQELRKMRKELTPMCFETGLREASAAQRLARLHLARRHVCANPLEPLARLESWLNARRRELEDSEENYWDVAHDRVEALAELLEEVNDYLVDGTPRGAPPPWDRYAEEIMELDDVVVYLNDGSGSRYVASISAPLPLRPARLAPSASALWNEAL